MFEGKVVFFQRFLLSCHFLEKYKKCVRISFFCHNYYLVIVIERFIAQTRYFDDCLTNWRTFSNISKQNFPIWQSHSIFKFQEAIFRFQEAIFRFQEAVHQDSFFSTDMNKHSKLLANYPLMEKDYDWIV